MSSATSSMPLAVAYWRRARRGSVLRSVPEPTSDDRDWIHTSLDSLTSAGSDEWVPPPERHRGGPDSSSTPGNGSTLVVFHALCLLRAVILLPNLLLDLLLPGSAEDPCLNGVFSSLGLLHDPVDALAELLGYASFTRYDDDMVLMGLSDAELATLVVAEYTSQPPPPPPPPSSPPLPPSAAALSSPRLSIVPIADPDPVSSTPKAAKSLGRSSSRGSSATARSTAQRRPWWMCALAPRAATTPTARAAPTAPTPPARPAWRVHVHDSDHAQCTICLTAYVGGDLVRVLPGCGHHFHGACVDPWLREHAPTCPLCQADLVPAVEAAAAVGGAVPLPSPVGGVLWRVEVDEDGESPA
ncbi:hypothetical protein GGF32_005497 [Allomyces javanicus]|nr:hypothetical protein GGF32_005497 [Allomyces javanicus]